MLTIALSHVRTAARNLLRHRLYAAINIGSLAVALVVAIIVALIFRADLRWDRCHEKAERIYQVFMPGPTSWQPNPPYDLDYHSMMPNALGAELVASIPGVRRSVRTFGMVGTVRYEGTTLEEYGQHAGPAFFEVFTFPLVRGNPATALSDPDAIVLSERLARKLFGDHDPMGRSVLLRCEGGGAAHVVTGVARDVPYASTLQFDWVIPFAHLEALWDRTGSWDLLGNTFLEVDDPGAIAAVEAWNVAQHVPDRELVALPLLDLHLHPDVGEAGAESFALYGSLALAVVLLAALNFANLGMSMSLVRAREVGVRKAIGAGRRQVAGQLLGEALLMSYLAVLLAVPLTHAILPGLNRLVTFPGDIDLRLDLGLSLDIVGLLVALGTVVGLAAGAYPAIAQSRLPAVQVLRDRGRPGGIGFGRTLVVVQFVVSVSFLALSMLVSRQAEHWRTGVDMGYDDEDILAIPTMLSRAGDRGIHASHRLLERFRREVLQVEGVAAVTGIDDYPGRMRLELQGAEVDVDEIAADPGFVRAMGLRLVEGEDLPQDLLAAGSAALVSRSLARLLDGPAVGSVLEAGHRPRIIGVVDDFVTSRPSDPTRPTAIVVHPEWGLEEILVRVRPDAGATTLQAIGAAWERAAPDVPFTYERMSQRRDEYLGFDVILWWLSGFMAFISVLGVFGLVSFATVRRTREVGVRKALGATAASVVWLFGAQFTRLVLLAVVLAWPLAWWMSEQFLGGSANRIGLDWASYVGAGAVALALTWMVSGIHMWRASRLNPAYCLRVE